MIKRPIDVYNYADLKVLSIRIREIVFSRRLTTYTDIANMLIKELTSKGMLFINGMSPEENVK